MAKTTRRPRRPRPNTNTSGPRGCAECHADPYKQHATWCHKSD